MKKTLEWSIMPEDQHENMTSATANNTEYSQAVPTLRPDQARHRCNIYCRHRNYHCRLGLKIEMRHEIVLSPCSADYGHIVSAYKCYFFHIEHFLFKYNNERTTRNQVSSFFNVEIASSTLFIFMHFSPVKYSSGYLLLCYL